ncbi:PC4 and SFRS1-interacting protein isoform X2 [Chelonus insularis]|uniref:PC4 and SFRS1-interacting protein isoform X2 n=1 Tax=Chelonus insularis TaxID=460826 RepID=UPI00158E29D6|nr:PC4 and SFRS1-interacting protein isoform X2 [Chelonus insularis]
MVKLKKKFEVGNKVFAKVRGYPPWPARVEDISESNPKGAKYKVFFYGTSETAVCKVDELFDYHENKEKFGKPIKRKMFHEGIQQLEQELDNDAGKSSSITESRDESESENPSVPTEPSSGVTLDSDIETGPLIIDEGNKKKPLKRKSLVTTALISDAVEIKKKRGRGKSLPATMIEAGNDSQGEETVGKEVVSRSGRKIKPKRFADFSADDEYELETTGRNRGKSKHEESNETAPTPSGRKKASIEQEDKKMMNKDSANQKFKIKWLRTESQLLTLDGQIKSNLSLDQADTDKCLQAMDEMLGLQIDPLTLKKHPHTVKTVKMLRRYIGNLAEWKLSEEEVIVFKQKAEQIRQKAEHIYNKFRALFTIPEDQSFWQSFSDQVDHFKEATKNMSEEKIFALMSDPTCSESTTVNDALSGDEMTAQGEMSTGEQDQLTKDAVNESATLVSK